MGADGRFFDERFFFFFEETDFCRRIIQAGGRIAYQPQAHLLHLQGESANKRPVAARVQFQDSRYKYFAKHYGAAAVSLLFAGTLLRTLAKRPRAKPDGTAAREKTAQIRRQGLCLLGTGAVAPAAVPPQMGLRPKGVKQSTEAVLKIAFGRFGCAEAAFSDGL